MSVGSLVGTRVGTAERTSLGSAVGEGVRWGVGTDDGIPLHAKSHKPYAKQTESMNTKGVLEHST